MYRLLASCWRSPGGTERSVPRSNQLNNAAGMRVTKCLANYSRLTRCPSPTPPCSSPSRPLLPHTAILLPMLFNASITRRPRSSLTSPPAPSRPFPPLPPDLYSCPRFTRPSIRWCWSVPAAPAPTPAAFRLASRTPNLQ
ncbi:hypothetical protein E2C01_027860 [Portunus trituberculatus]|uniref:Uncharacterized protein n=1 Tax=Portunus trituberculatus TaxID=210409 RepID=A0A5B7EMS4_PORTR|nr:hypothetical protein [Portunus trituberculatus]